MFPLFDAHCDTAGALFQRRMAGESGGLRQNGCHTDLLRGGAFAPRGQVYALWLPPEAGLSAPELQELFWAMAEHFRTEAEKNADVLEVCTTSGQIKAAFSRGKQAALLSVEGAELFGCTPAGLERAFELGVRIVHMCWNSSNVLCGAAADSGGGLTAAGRDFVQKCGELGVCIDLSHASDRTAWDVLEMNCTPVLASHSNCRALCPVPRNLPDTLLQAVAAAGGVVGLNLYPPFLGGEALSLAGEHALHLLELCGEGHVCLGCDFDGVDALPQGIRDIRDLPVLREALRAAGLSERQLNDLFFNDLMGFWERVL